MLSSNDRQFIKNLVDDIFLGFEVSGYLKIDELEEYVTTLVHVEKVRTIDEKKQELIKYSLVKIKNDARYQEFLTGKVKMCCYCKMIKPLISYYTHTGTIDNRRTECRLCKDNITREWKKNNKEKVLKYNQKYRENNPDRVREQKVSWRNNNIDKVREQQKRYYDGNKEKVLETKRKSYLKRFIQNKIKRKLTNEEAEELYIKQQKSGLTPSEFFNKIYMGV